MRCRAQARVPYDFVRVCRTMFHPDKTSAATSALSDFDDDDHQKTFPVKLQRFVSSRRSKFSRRDG